MAAFSLLSVLFKNCKRQLGDIRRDPPRFVFGEQLGRRAATGFIFIIDVAQRQTRRSVVGTWAWTCAVTSL